VKKLKEKGMKKKYIVKLTSEERAGLQQMISTRKAATRKLLHARILLKADASEEGPDGEMAGEPPPPHRLSIASLVIPGCR
jgi:hypothetical protein